MNAIQVLKALGPIDAKTVRRDSMLRWMIIYPIFLALLIRLAVPFATERLLARYQFDLVALYPLLSSFVLLMAAVLSGTVTGFLLLDQKDDQTLTALQVTPLSLSGYLTYRLTLPIVLSTVVALVSLSLTGLVTIGFFPMLLAAISAAPLAPLFALSLAALSSNKVQGFAWTKAMGILVAVPLLAYFVPPPWQWAFGIAPPYWPAKLYWLFTAREGGSALCFVVGLGYQVLWVSVLLRRSPDVR